MKIQSSFCEPFLLLSAKKYAVCTVNVLNFSTLFTKLMVIRTAIHKMLVRLANSEDPDQTASLEAV